MAYDPGEVIRLRNADRKLVDYRDTADTEHMRREIHQINEALRATRIDVTGYPVIHEIVHFEDVQFPLPQKLYHRSFMHSFSLGGRIYGPFWQWAPSQAREFLTINDEGTDDRDWRHFHPTLLYAQANATLRGDAYDVAGFSREDAKRAFAILINARCKRDALSAIREHLGLERGVGERARALYEGIKQRHAPIASWFASNVGVRLQRLDGDLIVRVHLRLLHEGVCALSVHDSVIGNVLALKVGLSLSGCGHGKVASANQGGVGPPPTRQVHPSE